MVLRWNAVEALLQRLLEGVHEGGHFSCVRPGASVMVSGAFARFMEAVFHTCFTFLMFLTFLTSTAPGPLPDTWAPLRRRLAPVPSNEDWARLKNEEGLLNDSLLDCSGGEMEDGRRWQGARNYWCDEILLELFDPSSVPFVHPKHELLVPSRLHRVAAERIATQKRGLPPGSDGGALKLCRRSMAERFLGHTSTRGGPRVIDVMCSCHPVSTDQGRVWDSE